MHLPNRVVVENQTFAFVLLVAQPMLLTNSIVESHGGGSVPNISASILQFVKEGNSLARRAMTGLTVKSYSVQSDAFSNPHATATVRRHSPILEFRKSVCRADRSSDYAGIS